MAGRQAPCNLAQSPVDAVNAIPQQMSPPDEQFDTLPTFANCDMFVL